ELPREQVIAADEIEPHALSERLELLGTAGHRSLRDKTSATRRILREAHHAAFRVTTDRHAVAPRPIRRRLLERHALRDQVAVHAIHVLHEEVERGLARRAPLLRRPRHRCHEADAGRGRGADREIADLGLLDEAREAQDLGIEALDSGHIMAGVVEVMMPRTDRVRGLVGRSGLRIGLGCGRRRRGWLRRRADRGAPRSAASRGLLHRARRRARTRGTELLYCHGLSSQEPPSVSRASTTATMPPSPGPAQARPPASGAVVLEPVRNPLGSRVTVRSDGALAIPLEDWSGWWRPTTTQG